MKKNQLVREMLVNRYGIAVKKCCASCQHKCLTDFAERKCALTNRRVKSRQKCNDWELSEGLASLGCERGRVQRREYQLTLLEVRASEDLARMRGQDIDQKPLEDIRKEFEDEHGSRFLF